MANRSQASRSSISTTKGQIAHITDFWPDPYEPPAGRAHLVERY